MQDKTKVRKYAMQTLIEKQNQTLYINIEVDFRIRIIANGKEKHILKIKNDTSNNITILNVYSCNNRASNI